MDVTSQAGPPLMASKATTCLLIALTLISPSACCCSFGAAADWVIQGIFLETGESQPASCCHRIAPPAASHDEGAQCHRRTNSGTESHCCSESHDGDSHRCPCREDGSGRSGPASPLDLVSASTSPVLSALQAPYVVPTLCGVANPEAIAPAFSSVPPHGLSGGGQGILRAYGRLRI